MLRRALLQSPMEHGFGTELWTLKRGHRCGCMASSTAKSTSVKNPILVL